MGKYLKMADVFNACDVVETGVKVLYAVSEEFDDGVTPHEYAHHAILYHDELVAEVERLRGMVIRMQTYLDMSGEYPEKESDNPVRQWLFDAIDCTK